MAQRGLVLDTGAVLALVRHDRRVRSFLAVAMQERVAVIIPPAVVTQVIRGAASDAEANRLLHAAFVPFVGERLARAAGHLLAESGLRDAADAQVVAEAGRCAPSTILTSDPIDIGLLASKVAGVRVIAI